MVQVKFAICLASYSIGNATEHSDLCWLGDSDWVDEFDEAAFFDDESSAENTAGRIMESEEAHGIDSRSLSIVKVLWSDCSDETNVD